MSTACRKSYIGRSQKKWKAVSTPAKKKQKKGVHKISKKAVSHQHQKHKNGGFAHERHKQKGSPHHRPHGEKVSTSASTTGNRFSTLGLQNSKGKNIKKCHQYVRRKPRSDPLSLSTVPPSRIKAVRSLGRYKMSRFPITASWTEENKTNDSDIAKARPCLSVGVDAAFFAELRHVSLFQRSRPQREKVQLAHTFALQLVFVEKFGPPMEEGTGESERNVS